MGGGFGEMICGSEAWVGYHGEAGLDHWEAVSDYGEALCSHEAAVSDYVEVFCSHEVVVSEHGEAFCSHEVAISAYLEAFCWYGEAFCKIGGGRMGHESQWRVVAADRVGEGGEWQGRNGTTDWH